LPDVTFYLWVPRTTARPMTRELFDLLAALPGASRASRKH
jgi:hypothetical protein